MLTIQIFFLRAALISAHLSVLCCPEAPLLGPNSRGGGLWEGWRGEGEGGWRGKESF